MGDLVHPVYVPDPKVLPSPEDSQVASIRPGSKLAVIGVFVEIIRRRFARGSAGPDFPWPWDRDTNTTRIEIESAFNEENSAKNKRPAVYVDADDQVNSRTVLGDFVGKRNTDGVTGFWHLETVPILIECVAAKRLESAIIGDMVSIFLLASNRLIQGKFGFHDMTPTTVGRTQPSQRDKGAFVTPVTFTVQNDVRYTNAPTGPLLEELEFAIAASGASSATEFFENVALRRESR
jgi:hypothetical protein